MVGVQTGEAGPTGEVRLRTNGDGVAVPAAPRRRPAATSTKVFGLLTSCGLLLVATFASIAYGTKSIPFGTVWDALWHYDASNNEHLIVRTLRIPRTVVGLGVGGALGLAGAVMQGVTRNPLADPAILGIEAGAALGVVVGIYSFGVGTLTGYVWFGFVGAAVASVVVYTLGSIGRGGATPVKLALAGGALAALLQSLTSAILLLDVETLDQYRFWAVGSLAGRDADVAVDVLPFLVVGMVLALVSAKALNTLALGDDMATSLGLPVQSARAICALAVVILCGAFIAPDAFPFHTQCGMRYYNGDYDLPLREALRLVDSRLHAEQAARRAGGDPVQLGVGISVYVEITAGGGGSEYGSVTVHTNGSATVSAGTSAHGQGHATAFAMLVHDRLGIPLERIGFVESDTATVPRGFGTGGSRSLQMGGSAVRGAARGDRAGPAAGRGAVGGGGRRHRTDRVGRVGVAGYRRPR